MRSRWGVLGMLVALLGVTPHIAAPSHPPSTISIVINGDVLPLNPPPRWVGGRLFVPVRRTIEALGLDFVRDGRVIATQIGAKSVSLTVGSRAARIDGQNVLLDAAPMEVHDVLYAPLRFFTDVLGAQAAYDRRANSVHIVAELMGRSGAGIMVRGNTIERIGTVSAIDLDSSPPTITLTYNASVRTIPIGANAIIDMHDVDANVTVPGELGDVRPGDFAHVFMQKNGHVERVEDAYGSHNGLIAAVAGEQFVLGDGHVISPGRTAIVSLNGKTASVADLRVGDRVTVRYNVETSEVREILASRTVAQPAGTPGPVQIASVEVDANHALHAGERINVTMHGTAGGAAEFDIGPYVTHLAMAERQSGTYAASYTIPRGANFSEVPIIGHLRVGTTAAPDVQASQTLSASSTPPGISEIAPDEGASVNTTHPAIFVTFAPGAVPVNPSSVILWVNGRDVTANCLRTAQFIQYMPSYSYPVGPVHVTVRVADRAGNTTIKSWAFTIRTR